MLYGQCTISPAQRNNLKLKFLIKYKDKKRRKTISKEQKRKKTKKAPAYGDISHAKEKEEGQTKSIWMRHKNDSICLM
jgi:hypothetical protein